MRTAAVIAITSLLATTLGAGGFVYYGLYDVAADVPHAAATSRVLEVVRDRSVARSAARVHPPDLEEPRRVLEGAGQYAAMCAICHLAPGMNETSLAKGLQPRPPRLHEQRREPREAFVIIKHGLKMTGMPAWGAEHSDAQLWSLVAFLNALPGMSAQQYQDIVKGARAVEQATEAGPASGANGAGAHEATQSGTGHRHDAGPGGAVGAGAR